MTTPFQHIRSGPWPSHDYRVAAVLRAEPDELHDCFGLEFTSGYDDLDYFRAVSLRLGSGRRVDLVRYRGHPQPGTEVWVDAGDDVAGALRDLLLALRLADSDVSWRVEVGEPGALPSAEAPAPALSTPMPAPG